MSSGLASRLKHPKKHELVKSHSQAQILANKLRQDGVMVAVENVLQAVDQMAALLASNIPQITYKDSIINLCQHLKVYGAYLEILYKEQLDHAFKIFRDKAQDDIRVDILSRLHLLELIELRAKGWKGTDGMNVYYKKKMNQCSQIDLSESLTSVSDTMSSVLSLNSSPPLLGPGEIIKPSGKFAKPTRIPGKKYCKDEVVIRNADSGKVMGIKGRRVHMIEELSETIISFQRVSPGAKERLVQITGANEDSINHAKQLIEDTIRRNASPVRDSNANGALSGNSGSGGGGGGGGGVGGPLTGSSSSINSSASDDSALPSSNRVSRALMHSLSTPDANLGEYKYTVITNGRTIKITGDDLDLVRTSKLVLDEYFSGEPIHDVAQFYSFDSLPQPILPTDLTDEVEKINNKHHESSPVHGDSVVVNGQLSSSPSSTIGPSIDATSSLSASSSVSNQNNEKPESKIHSSSLMVQEFAAATTNIININNNNNDDISKRHHIYSIESLAQLAMSPLCLTEPKEWKTIVEEHPNIIRQDVQIFDAKRYLSKRTDEEPEY